MSALRVSFGTVIFLGSAVTIAGIGLGYAGLVQLAFLPLCMVIGLWTFAKSPYRNFVTFVILLWLYSPFVRRLVDWQLGRTDPSVIILTPYLVTLIAAIGVLAAFSRQHQERAFFVVILAICFGYGFLSGLLQGNRAASVFDFLSYAAPLCFAAHLLNNQSHLSALKNHLSRLIAINATIIAIYGIIQFTAPAPWDIAWMEEAPIASLGEPVAYQLRVFSTMSAPVGLAMLLLCALLILPDLRSTAFALAALPIALCLWLTLVRSSWLALAIGLAVFLVFATSGKRTHLLLLASFSMGLVAVIMVVLGVPPLLTQRLASLLTLSNDISLAARASILSDYLPTLSEPLGQGLGSTGISTTIAVGGPTKYRNFDNGILDLVYSFGWAGLLVLACIGFKLYNLVRHAPHNTQSVAATAALCALSSQLLFFNPLTGATGVLFFILMVLALPATQQAIARGHRSAKVRFV